MILRTLVPNVWNPREGREHEWLPVTGSPLRAYLPSECVAPDTPSELFAVSHNGRLVPPGEWDTVRPIDGDGIAVTLRPLGVETLAVIGVSVILNASLSWYGNRRAKVDAHHAARRAAAEAEAMRDSYIYGWHGIQNSTEPGRPIPVLYGRHRVGGHVVYAETRIGKSASQAALDMVLAISEGEIDGPETPLSSTVEVNGKRLSSYPGATADSRNGLVNQTTMANVWPANTPRSEITVNANLALNTPVTQVSAANIDNYSVILKIDNLQLVTSTGQRASGTAEFEFRVRHRLLPSGAFVTSGTFKTGALLSSFAGITTAPHTQTYKNPTFLTEGQYEIEVTLISQTARGSAVLGGTANRFVSPSSQWRFQTLRNFTEFGPQYPGLAVLGFSALPSASLSGALPTVTSIWRGRKVGIWNNDTPATFTDTYSQNPAWCALDVLRSKTYGAGQHFDIDRDVDLPSVLDSANFSDELVGRGLIDPLKSGSGTGSTTVSTNLFTASGSPNFTDGTIKVDDTLVIFGGADAGSYRILSFTGTTLLLGTVTPPVAGVVFAGSSGVSWEIRNTERRSKCDHYFDGTTTVWKAVEAICTNARIAVVRTNGRVKFTPDRARTITQIFGMGNVRNYRHQYLGGSKATRFEGQFLDETKNWEQQVAAIEDPEVQAGVKPPMKVQIECFGVTRKTQVLRILNYQMLSNQMETQMIEFETDAMALAVEWGDVIQFNHDVMPRKQPFLSAEPLESGRVLAGSSPTALHLDRAVTWGPYNRRVQIQSLADDLIRNARVNEPDGTVSDFPAVTGLGGYTPAEGDVWTAEPEFIDSPPPNKWKVIGVTRTQDGHARVRAVIYRDEMFNALTGVDAIMLAQV